MRKFEKISFEQFKKDINDDILLYDSYEMPKRNTSSSAGYDFVALADYTLNPGESMKIPTGIKAAMNELEVLMIFVRSSMGFKYNVRLCNQVGIIDADYYNNQDNEGHIWVKLQNEGIEPYNIKKGDKFSQGMFTTFLTVDDEEKINKERIGGLGSTDKEE